MLVYNLINAIKFFIASLKGTADPALYVQQISDGITSDPEGAISSMGNPNDSKDSFSGETSSGLKYKVTP